MKGVIKFSNIRLTACHLVRPESVVHLLPFFSFRLKYINLREDVVCYRCLILLGIRRIHP